LVIIVCVSTHALVVDHADRIERLEPGVLFALRLDDCEPEERILLIEHHSRVMNELRLRGHQVRAGISRDPHGFECLRIRIVAEDLPAPGASIGAF
jgi:hypothetical protein